MTKQLTKIHPLQFSQFGVQFSVNSIAQTTIWRAIRYQFKQIGAVSGQDLIMRNDTPQYLFFTFDFSIESISCG